MKKIKKTFILFVLFIAALTLTSAAMASTGPFSNDPADYTFELFDVNDGLPSSYITSLTGGPDGSIFVGTWSATLKFDGSTFSKLSDSGRAEGVTPTHITSLYYDAAKDVLWISSIFNKNAGLFRYQNGQFIRYSKIDGLPSDNISAITGGGGKIFIGTWGGALAVYANDKFEIINKNNGLSDNFISSLAYSERTGELWAATKFSGANLIIDSKIIIMDDHTSSLVNNYVHKIAIDESQNSVYFGTSGGISKYNGSAWQNIITGPESIADNFIKDIFIFRSASYDKPIVYFVSSGVLSIFYNESFFNFDIIKFSGRQLEINAIYVDEKNIYLGTDKGVCKIGRRN